MSTGPWSDVENDATVADYFEMLVKDVNGSGYSKAEHRRSLMKVVARPEKGIEFKHQNISAVLLGLGQPWITGYKPAANFQTSLIDAVLRRLRKHDGWAVAERAHDNRSDPAARVGEDTRLWIGPPPTFSNQPPQIDIAKMAEIALRYDVAEQDERNRRLGKVGEERVLAHERAALRSAGRRDLADRVRWTSAEDGDGPVYDIASFEADGSPRLVEVKTTNGWERTPFHISRNELAVADAHRNSWHLVRLWNFEREPRAFAIRPPLQGHVELTPTSFLARLK